MNTLYMETTKKEPEQTSAEIESLLSQYELTRFMKDYENGEVIGCYFTLKINGKDVPIRLPVRWQPIMQMAETGDTKYIKPGDEQQAKRVAWRQVYRWIESQLALVDLEMVEIAEVFLPYMMINKKQTLFQHMSENGMKLLIESKDA